MLGFDSYTFYIGRDLQYFIISCLAVPIVFASLIDIGALFHILVASPMKEVSDLGSFRFSFVKLSGFVKAVTKLVTGCLRMTKVAISYFSKKTKI